MGEGTIRRERDGAPTSRTWSKATTTTRVWDDGEEGVQVTVRGGNPGRHLARLAGGEESIYARERRKGSRMIETRSRGVDQIRERDRWLGRLGEQERKGGA